MTQRPRSTRLLARLGAATLAVAQLTACGAPAEPLVCPTGASVVLYEYPEERGGGRGERCERADGTREGPSRDFYADGTVRSITSWLDGVRHGKSTLWYPNGAKQREIEHDHFVAVGVWTDWDEQGNVTQQQDFGHPGASPQVSPSTGTSGADAPVEPAPGS